jgi:hypothetical protein
MSTTIDFRTLPVNVPSLCIPRVFMNWTEIRIRGIFDTLCLGEILRIDVVTKTTEKGEKFNRVFIHFKHWFSNHNADTARERLLNGKDVKIIYDEPWFWKVSAYRENTKSAAVLERPRPSIKFDDERTPRNVRRNIESVKKDLHTKKDVHTKKDIHTKKQVLNIKDEVKGIVTEKGDNN